MTPAIIQQVTDIMLSDCKFAIAYLYEILIKSETREQHCEYVKRVFEKIGEYKQKVNGGECVFLLK